MRVSSRVNTSAQRLVQRRAEKARIVLFILHNACLFGTSAATKCSALLS
jgi:hypothetical protein